MNIYTDTEYCVTIMVVVKIVLILVLKKQKY